jgi:hypothetical protein
LVAQRNLLRICGNYQLRNVFIVKDCPERDSNPQGLLHQILSLARLPIPPPGLSFSATDLLLLSRSSIDFVPL